MTTLKIKINYDLLQKLAESNTGLTLKDSLSKVLVYTTIATSITGLMAPTKEELARIILHNITFYLTLVFGSDLMLSGIKKDIACKQLRNLIAQLKNLDINTNLELLQKAEHYKTEYETSDSFPPEIKQNKYIMVTVLENGKEIETSIVQEHILGTDEYYISYGSPKRVLQKVPKFA